MHNISRCAGTEEWVWRKQFISDVFHTLSQPLTALQCSLEFALRNRKGTDLIDAVQDALEMTRRAIESVKFVRLLVEAEDPGEVEAVELGQIVRELSKELQPVAESQSTTIRCRVSGDLHVLADGARLSQALFLLSDTMLERSGRRELFMVGRRIGSHAQVEIGTAPDPTGYQTEIMREDHGRASRAELVAKHIIEAAGGNLLSYESDTDFGRLVRFPLSPGTE